MQPFSPVPGLVHGICVSAVGAAAELRNETADAAQVAACAYAARQWSSCCLCYFCLGGEKDSVCTYAFVCAHRGVIGVCVFGVGMVATLKKDLHVDVCF